MKKTIVLFLSIVFVAFASGKTSKIKQPKTDKSAVEKQTNDKQKTDKPGTEKQVSEKTSTDKQKTEKSIADKQKTAVQKDTIKKIKVVDEEQEIDSDSLLLEKGDFKFYKKSAHASYYADKFHGRRTASGKKYDKNKYTAAHKKLPLGTKVKITNEANGKSVIVEITDRGPFVRTREIDLSKRAFMDIANNKASGAMMVTIEVLQK